MGLEVEPGVPTNGSANQGDAGVVALCAPWREKRVGAQSASSVPMSWPRASGGCGWCRGDGKAWEQPRVE